MDRILLTTLGEGIRRAVLDRSGNPVTETKESAAAGLGTRKPVYRMLYSNKEESKNVHYLVESESQGEYEIKVRWKENARMDDARTRQELLSHFSALQLYYSKVNVKHLDICPVFYQFKILPEIEDAGVKRAFECEEFMGIEFIKELATQVLEHRKIELGGKFQLIQTGNEQGSLPAYAWGVKLAKLCQKLEQVELPEIDECGELAFENGNLVGTVAEAEFYEGDRSRYEGILYELRHRWHRYLISREIE